MGGVGTKGECLTGGVRTKSECLMGEGCRT